VVKPKLIVPLKLSGKFSKNGKAQGIEAKKGGSFKKRRKKYD
jgi:hypothetical protein